MLLFTQNGYQYSGGQQPAMVVRDACPECQSSRYKKNGHTRTGKQNHQCNACGRQFVSSPEDRLISDEQRTLMEHLLRERISPRGICRAVGVSLPWLLHCMVECFAACPDHLHVRRPAGPTEVVIHQLEAEADEMWSFVGKRANKQWIWIALDAQTRQVIAFHVGDRRRESTQALWATLPGAYREQARFHTDRYEAYRGVIPAERHQAITKQARKTNHIGRFNNTLRQRLSRLVRETLSFSKTLANHIGAIRYFICHYNLMGAAALPV
jgi:insertion element IS1 protein InsB